MKIKSIVSIGLIAVSVMCTGCSSIVEPKQTVTQEEVVFESENNDISISLTGYEYAPKSEPCFVIRFKSEKSTERKLVCTAYDVKIDGVLAEENTMYNLADFEDSNVAQGSIAFGSIDKYNIDFENAKQIEFEYNVRDVDDPSFTYNGSAMFELKSNQ